MVGRRWAIARIRDWLASSERVLMITGAPGTGKTALVGALPAAQGLPRIQALAVHNCRGHLLASTDPIRIVASIADQLARRMPDYRALQGRFPRGDNPIRSLGTAVFDSGSTRAAYERGLLSPFDILASMGRLDGDVLVVLDGLDEGSPASAPAINELLEICHDNPVPGLRMLLTMRPGVINGVRAETFDLTGDCPPGCDDIGEYLAASTSLRRRRRRMIAAAASGSYVYARSAARLSARFRSRELPDSMDGLYQLWLNRLGLGQFGSWVLSLLASSRDHGFTEQEIAILLGASQTDVASVLSQCRDLLRGGRYLRPHHRCLAEHLRHTPERDVPADLDWRIAADLLRRWEGRWSSCDRSYGLRNVLAHLADVAAEDDQRRDAARAAIDQTISDPQFLVRAVTRIGVENLLCAIRYARRRLPARLELLDDADGVLTAQAAPLRLARSTSDPDLAIQQLVYQAASVGATGLGRAIGGDVLGIQTMWATVDSPLRYAPAARRGHYDQVADIAITATGEKAITTARDGTTKVWWLASGRLAHELAARDGVTSLLPAPDGSHVVTTGANGRAEIWHTDSGEAVGELVGGRTAKATAFAVNANSTVGVTGDFDGDATVWDLRVGEPVVRLPCRSLMVSAVAVSAEGSVAATGTWHGAVTVWDTATGVSTCSFDAGTQVSALALTPDVRRIIVGGDESLTVHELETVGSASVVATLWTCRRVTAIAVNPAIADYVLVGTASGQVAYIRLPA